MSRSPERVLLVVVAGIVLVAVVAAVLAALRSEPSYGRGTPERTVQRYLTAILEGDSSTAAGLLAEDSPCAEEELRQTYRPDDVRIVLVGTTVEGGGESARVQVKIVHSDSGLFYEEYDEEHVFELTRSGEEWRIEGAPWPVYECMGGR